MGILIVVVSGVLWGLNYVFINIFSLKIDILTTSVMTIIFSLMLVFVQDVSSCVSIFSYHYIKDHEKFWTQVKSLKKVVWLLLIAAICAGPIYAGVITSCYPVVALILAIVFLKERPTKIKS